MKSYEWVQEALVWLYDDGDLMTLTLTITDVMGEGHDNIILVQFITQLCPIFM